MALFFLLIAGTRKLIWGLKGSLENYLQPTHSPLSQRVGFVGDSRVYIQQFSRGDMSHLLSSITYD